MQILKIKSIINEPEKGNNAKVTFVVPMLLHGSHDVCYTADHKSL